MSWDFLSWEGSRGPQWCAALSTASKSGLLSEGFTVLFVSCVAPSLAFGNQICYSFSLLPWRERSADWVQSSTGFCFSLLVEFPSFIMVKFTLREPDLYREHPYIQQGPPAEIRRQNRVKNWTWEERSSEREESECVVRNESLETVRLGWLVPGNSGRLGRIVSREKGAVSSTIIWNTG